MNQLDPLRLSLQGRQLIEASAGTGKTYTIANLFIRLLTGHGKTSFGNPLPVEQILVVTFTRAATEELKDRIRRRIMEAITTIRDGHSDDPFLQQWRDDLSVVNRLAQAERWLDAAAKSMDRAAIFTIHGYCARVLTEFAFETGAFFDATFEDDETRLLEQAVKDYWRSHFYALDSNALAASGLADQSPDSLVGQVRGWLNHQDPEIHLPDNTDAIRQGWYEAYTGIRERLKKLKSDGRLITNNDLLTLVYEGLNGDKAASLASALSARYPAAMIDEFQDTDGVQYGIFNRVYQRNASTLLMIGDPKQAIYGFRGGDIYTYMAACQALTEDQRHTLSINWRSSSAYVQACNQLYEHAGEQAFLLAPEIRYIPVDTPAHCRADREALVDNADRASIVFCQASSPEEDVNGVSAANAAAPIAHWCADEIARLLAEGKLGDSPVRAGDIAILVRRRKDADKLITALANKGIGTVLLQDDSIFSTAIAADLYQVLAAMMNARHESQVRGAMASKLMQRTIDELAEFRDNDERLQWLFERFSESHHLWQKTGIVTATYRLLDVFDVPARWRRIPDAARQMTDLRHLLELLQEQSQTVTSVPGLLGWFKDRIRQAQLGISDTEDSRKLRLDTDRHLVRVVTIHASKGLEYPIVFIPDACWYKDQKSASVLVYQSESDTRKCIDFSPDQSAEEKVQQELLAEDLRLLYVALTRAVHRCYLGVYAQMHRKSLVLHHTAIGHLLKLEEAADDCALSQRLSELASHAGICQADAADHPEAPGKSTDEASAKESLRYRSFQRALPLHWRIMSYSGLIHAGSSPGAAQEAPGTDEQQLAPAPVTPLADDPSRFSFEKGARAGTLLHHVLEQQDFTCTTPMHWLTTIGDALADAGFPPEDQTTWSPVLQDWLQEVVDTPLRSNHSEFQLANITDAQKVVEMEFHFAVERSQKPDQWQRILQRSIPEFPEFKGLLKGFIDLVVEWQGRYYVLDYKSNWLGNRFEDYVGDVLAQAIRAHHYDLQYLIYTVALHRYLKTRLPDYRYERHMGGVFYLFLRGMSPLKPGAGVFYTQPDASLIDALDTLLGGS